jgi:hypothetical protein
VDRLEAGAILTTGPFVKLGELDHAAIQVKATKSIISYIEDITLVINDYVIFELTKADLTKWNPPLPPMNFQIVHGKMDSSGKLSDAKGSRKNNFTVLRGPGCSSKREEPCAV